MDDINFNLEEFEKFEGVVKKSDNRIWVIAVIILVGVLVGSYFLNKCSGTKKEPTVKVDSIAYWRDQFNREHAKTSQIEITDKSQLPASMQGEYDSLLKLYRLKDKNLQEYTKALIEARGHVDARLIAIHDTFNSNSTDTIVGDLAFDYRDRYMDMSGVVEADSVHINYAVEAPITVTQYWKRKWFLGSKQYFIDGYSDNPNVHISNLHEVRIKEKVPSRWGVGPMVGWNLFDNKPFLGVGVFYRVF